MGVRQAIPALARRAPEELGPEQSDEQRAAADGPQPTAGRADGGAPGIRLVAPRVTALRHQEHEQDREREAQRAAKHDRDAEVDGREYDADRQADEPRDLRQLRLAEEERS